MNTQRPFVLLKIAQSLDGYLDNNSEHREVFSNIEDCLEVDKLRADCDAIVVGAQTVRKDNPTLLVRSDELKEQRISQGKPRYPIKVTYSKSGDISLECNFVCLGECQKIIYISRETLLKEDFGFFVEIVRTELTPSFIINDLYARGAKKILIEGGAQTAFWFLKENLVDQIRLALAPKFLRQTGGVNLGDFFIEKYALEHKVIAARNLNGMLIIDLERIRS